VTARDGASPAMPQLKLQKKELPFLLGGSSQLALETADLKLNQPLAEGTGNLLNATLAASGNQAIALSGDNTIKLGITASTAVELIPIFSSTKGASLELLKANGIGEFFDNNANKDKVVLAFTVGGTGQVSASGSFSYAALKVGTQINAGGDGAYAYLRALDKKLPIEKLLMEFFSTMRLPEQPREGGIQAGEALALRYGGYLRIAADASVGYKLSGTKSVSIGSMALSEKYDLSILGKVGITAGIAGQFSIIVNSVADQDGWARVRVHRHNSRSLGIAADVTVGFKNELENLPPTANEFLGAALGVNAKNFLTVFDKARELSDFEKFKGALDGLAKRYISEYVNKGFDELEKINEFKTFMAQVNKVSTSYDTLGDRAVTLFDRYFDQLPALNEFLEKIQDLQAEGLDKLRKDLNPQLWNMLSQLTDGDPLAFLLQQVTIRGKKIDALVELKGRAATVKDLMFGAAHQEIRRAIELGKKSFGIDKFFGELATIDTVDELKSVANDKIGQFVTRLVGRSLDSSTNLKEAFKEVQAVLEKIDGFKEKLFTAFKEAMNSSYRVSLHAGYTRASEADSLIDVLINLSEPNGARLLAQAGKGDFEEVLATPDANLVRLREGVFTHKLTRESAFKVHIAGWHLNYSYEGFDRVITETEQRVMPSGQGITIVTTAKLEVERMRKRQNEQTHMNFLLRALGESAKAVKSDPKTTMYLIDTLNMMTARYELSFTDDQTSLSELQDYLSFARELGLAQHGANLETLDPLLPRASDGGFGRVEVSYDVRFGEEAVTALLSVKTLSESAELTIRTAMRRMLLANYLKSDALHDVAFAYATPGVFLLFDEEGPSSFTNHFQRVFLVKLLASTIAAPTEVSLDKTELEHLKTLYMIENEMVDSIRNLIKVIHSKTPINPQAFEKKLGKFGDALTAFDSFDQTTSARGVGSSTIFAMFDILVRLASPGIGANISVLRLQSAANGKTVEKLFLSDAAN
jgi:hypothetical protein